MKKTIESLLKFTILLYAILHFTTVFFPVEALEHFLSIVGATMFLLTIFHLTVKKFKLPIFILSMGIIIFYLSNTAIITGLINGFLLMRDMVGLLIILPLVGWVLREEPYIEDIMALFFNFINTSKKFYLSMMAFTQVFSYFLLFGSIPMMHQFVNVILKNQTSLAWENYKSTALLRGFALTTMWVISIPSFIFVVEVLEASLWITILQGMIVSFGGILLAVIFAHFTEKKYGVDLTPTLQKEIANAVKNASPKEVRVKKVIEFVLLFVTLFGTIFLLHGLFDLKLMILIPLVIVVWVFSFYLIRRKRHRIKHVLNGYYNHNLTNQTHQLNMMLAVGVLIYSLNQTNFPNTVVNSLNYIQEIFPFINVLFLLPFIIIFLGFIGLGPLTVMVLVAGILESMSFPYPSELIVLSVTSGSVISILLSPLIMPVIVLSAANKLSYLTNSAKFNWKFAFSFYILVQAYIQTVVYFGNF